jgi:hypothetical protein
MIPEGRARPRANNGEVKTMETGTIISLGALLIALVSLILNSRKETRTDAAATARIETSLGTLNSGVNDIRVDLRSMRESLAEHSERLIRVETVSQNNARRLDALEKKGA